MRSAVMAQQQKQHQLTPSINAVKVVARLTNNNNNNNNMVFQQ